MSSSTHRHRSPLVAATLLAGLLAACGKPGSDAATATAAASGAGPGAAAAASAPGPAGSAPPVGVTTVRAAQRDMPVLITATGTVAAMSTVDVRPQVTSLVTQVHVKEGQFVKQGQLLFSLDPRADQANVAKAQAQLARDEAALADAQRQLRRSQELLAQNFISQGALDTSQTNVQSLTAALAADRAALDAAKLGLSYTRIVAPGAGRLGAINVFPGSSVQANVTTMASITQLDPINVGFSLPQRHLADALAALKDGGAQVSVTLPDAEGAAVAAAGNAGPGSGGNGGGAGSGGAGGPAGRDGGNAGAAGSMPQGPGAGGPAGAGVTGGTGAGPASGTSMAAATPAGPGASGPGSQRARKPTPVTLTGRLKFVDNAVDATTGTVKVKAQFDNAAGKLWPGAFVNVAMTARTIAGAVVVPQAAIIQSARGPFVYAVREDKAVPRPVEVLYAQGDDAAVSGVRPGERIVMDGRQNLRPGTAVVERAGGGGKGGGGKGERGAAASAGGTSGAAPEAAGAARDANVNGNMNVNGAASSSARAPAP